MSSEDAVVRTCAKHQYMPVSTYCVYHHVCMCITCLLQDHKDCIDYVEAIGTVTQKFKDSSNDIHRKSDRLKTNVSDSKNRKIAWVENLDKVEIDLLHGLRRMKFSILSKVEKLASEAMDMTKSVLDEQKKMYLADIEVLSDFEYRLGSIQKTLDKHDICQSSVGSLNEILAVEDKMEEIENDFRKKKLKSGDIKVHFYVSEIVSEIENHFQTFGELCVEDVTERVRSLYLSPSGVQRYSLDNIDEQEERTRFLEKDSLFLYPSRDETPDIYLAIDPTSAISRECKAPPLPTMENRLLSPTLFKHKLCSFSSQNHTIDHSNGISSVATDSVTSAESKDLDTECSMNESDGTPQLDLQKFQRTVTPSVVRKKNPRRSRKSEEFSKIQTPMFYEPCELNDNLMLSKELETKQPKDISKKATDSKDKEETTLTIPNLPRRTIDLSRSLLPTSNQNLPKSRLDIANKVLDDQVELRSDSHLKHNKHELWVNGSSTLPRTKLRLTRKHNHGNDLSTGELNDNSISHNRPVSNSRNCSDGCCSTHISSRKVPSEELPVSIERSDNISLTIPRLPSRDERKMSVPALPVSKSSFDNMRKKHLNDKLHIDDRRRSNSVPDVKGDVTYIRANDKTTFKNNNSSIVSDLKPNTCQNFRQAVKSEGSETNKCDALYPDIIVDVPANGLIPDSALCSSLSASRIDLDRSKVKHASFITGMAVSKDGYIVICDNRNDVIELFDDMAALKDTLHAEKPFGCCYIRDNRFAVTSKEKRGIILYEIQEYKLKLADEKVIETAQDIFGLSFSYGFFCVSCLTEIKLLRDGTTQPEITIKPLEKTTARSRSSWFNKPRPPKPFFSDVQYAVMERLDERFYLFTSELKKKRVTCVDLSGIVVWIQPDTESRSLVFHARQLVVATDKYITFLNAATGDHVRDIRLGIPKSPWGLAIDKRASPWLLVSGCGKACSRQVMRIGLSRDMKVKSSTDCATLHVPELQVPDDGKSRIVDILVI